MLVIGHRGAAGYAPENTLRSFSRAIELGVDYVEADLQLTRDGEIVVFHDKLLDRVTNASGYLRDRDFEDLREDARIGDERIPSLRELCDLLRGTSVGLMAEVVTPGAETPALRIIDERLGLSRCLVASFHHDVLRNVRATAPDVDTIALVEGAPIDPVRMLADCGATCAGLGFDSIRADQVSLLREAGARVLAWTVNDAREISRAASMGVDGVISDFPDRVRAGLSATATAHRPS